MVAYLNVRSGPEKGRQFQLDRSRPMHIGRGASCEIVLTDPISSRFHAVVFHEDGNWHLRDTSSRNGTLVNGQKTDHARLLHHSTISIGGTDMQLIEPEVDSSNESFNTVTIENQTFDPRSLLSDIEDPIDGLAQTGHLIDLYQLSLQLLTGSEPDDVIETAIELLKDRTQAEVVGLSVQNDDSKFKTFRVVPAEMGEKLALPTALLKKVVADDQGIWLGDPQSDIDRSKIKGDWDDAIFVSVPGADNFGALYLYRSENKFERHHYEFAASSGRLLAFGLSRLLQNKQLRVENERISMRNADSNELIGDGQAMTSLKSKISRVGKANGSVLIRGESGAGKELVARAVHRASVRNRRPMLTVNCAAIPRDLIESQLFGHKKGAFTGADNDHTGWFEQADSGTLFLDEIGELTLEGQAKLLRILEGHPFLPVGATAEVSVDVRVIAATNRDLAEFVREKQFREDLFYRLSVFELLVPPLRDRGEDIDRLIDHFLDHFRRQHGRPELKLLDDARGRLREYPWPGNVRQLRNVIDSAVVMADDPAIEADDLGLHDAGLSRLDTLRIDLWEERLIRKALSRTKGSVPESAKLLGISRATAYRKISDYDIER